MNKWEDKLLFRVINIILFLAVFLIGITLIAKAPALFKLFGVAAVIMSIYMFIKTIRIIKTLTTKK